MKRAAREKKFKIGDVVGTGDTTHLAKEDAIQKAALVLKHDHPLIFRLEGAVIIVWLTAPSTWCYKIVWPSDDASVAFKLSNPPDAQARVPVPLNSTCMMGSPGVSEAGLSRGQQECLEAAYFHLVQNLFKPGEYPDWLPVSVRKKLRECVSVSGASGG